MFLFNSFFHQSMKYQLSIKTVFFLSFFVDEKCLKIKSTSLFSFCIWYSWLVLFHMGPSIYFVLPFEVIKIYSMCIKLSKVINFYGCKFKCLIKNWILLSFSVKIGFILLLNFQMSPFFIYLYCLKPQCSNSVIMN